jgi:hypothetical protein
MLSSKIASQQLGASTRGWGNATNEPRAAAGADGATTRFDSVATSAHCILRGGRGTLTRVFQTHRAGRGCDGCDFFLVWFKHESFS